MWLVGNPVSTGRLSGAWVAPGPASFLVDIASGLKIPQLVLELILLAPIHAG